MTQEIISEFYEYQITFTNQLTQKNKLVWFDGTLKYFKFNKKAIVYNQEKKVVTSSFLKNDHSLKESNWGEDIRVGGAFVRIDSLVSRSSRDISNVFKKSTANDATNIRIPGPLRTISTNTSITATPIINSTVQIPKIRRRVGLSRSSTPSQLKKKHIASTHSTSSPTYTASTPTASHAGVSELTVTVSATQKAPSNIIGTTKSRSRISRALDSGVDGIRTDATDKTASHTNITKCVENVTSCRASKTGPSTAHSKQSDSSGSIGIESRTRKFNLNPLSTRSSRSLLVTRNKHVSISAGLSKDLSDKAKSSEIKIINNEDIKLGLQNPGIITTEIRETSKHIGGTLITNNFSESDDEIGHTSRLIEEIDEVLRNSQDEGLFGYNRTRVKKEKLDLDALEEKFAREDHISWDFGDDNDNNNLINKIQKSIKIDGGSSLACSPDSNQRLLMNNRGDERLPLLEVDTNRKLKRMKKK